MGINYNTETNVYYELFDIKLYSKKVQFVQGHPKPELTKLEIFG